LDLSRQPKRGLSYKLQVKEAYCSVCGKKLDPLKMVMDEETLSGKTELRKFYGKNASVEVEVYDYEARKGYYVIFCLNCISKDFYWGEKDEEEED
jgi:hypothetical protein